MIITDHYMFSNFKLMLNALNFINENTTFKQFLKIIARRGLRK